MCINKLFLVNPENLKKPGVARKISAVLTGKDRGEEDVVGKGNESTFSERIEDAVLVGKLLPLLGQLLVIHPSHTPKRAQKAPD